MKKILLIGLEMNGYLLSIKESLEKRSFQVTLYEKFGKINKKDLTNIERVIRFLAVEYNIQFFKNKYNELEKKYFKEYISELESDYDYVLDMFAQSKYNFINELKFKLTKAKFKLFLWDDIKYKKIDEVLKLYDEVFSYNKEDANEIKAKYRSNFYVKEFIVDKKKMKYDILYIGGLRDDKRIKILEKLDEISVNNKFFLIGKDKIKNNFKYKNYKKAKKYLKDNYFNVMEISKYTKESQIILDLIYKEQNGLSLRPFEAIASKAKLITTNKNIKEYDFYNTNNVFYLEEDMSNVEDLKIFIKLPFQEYSENIKYKYSIESFIDDIFWEELNEKGKINL